MKLYNTLTRKKEEFVPLDEGKVTMYSCGPTVYNYFHVGNARPFIVFDSLRRYLEYRGYEVAFVQNFTDVDDKIINRANDEKSTMNAVSERFIEEYFKDARALGIKEATVHPKATENIDAIIELVKQLEEKGYAYHVDGNVYFSTKNFKDYGKLSHQPLEDLEIGARIEENTEKKDGVDFALWKKAKEGEPWWESPWGKGRPGWHIECSAMANRYLGKTIDIHSGGQDLIFPHHENEIAQSEAASGCEFARFWLHNGYINIDNQKMSKSLGNFFTVRDIAKDFDYEVIRFFMLSAQYRSPVNFSKELMEQAKAGLERLYNCVEGVGFALQNGVDGTTQDFSKFNTAFIEALDDDFNTALAISVLFELAKEVNKSQSREGLELLKELGGVLGFLQKEREQTDDSEIGLLIQQRQDARAAKDFALADKIRDKLAAQGITLQDTPNGVKWSK